MSTQFRRIARSLVLLIAVCVTWMVVEMMRGTSSHRLVDGGTANWSLVITPGRPIWAFYLFLMVLTLIPPVCCIGLMYGGGSPRLRGLYAVLAIAGLSVASIVAGFGYEALRCELRVTADRLSYRAGSESTQIRWQDVGMMVLRWHRRSQSLELRGPTESVRIDLSTFAVPDQILLLQNLQNLAHLRPVRHRSSNEWVWRRTLQINLPTE